MVSLKNSYLSLTVDEKGRIVELLNHSVGGKNIIARPTALFHTIIQNGTNWEEVAYANDAELTVSANESSAIIHVTALNTRRSHFDIEMTLTLTLDGERVLFDAEINNPTDAMITDFIYPCVGGIKTLGAGAPDLLYPAGFGELHKNIIKQLVGKVGRDTAMLLSGIYPFTQSMQCMMLLDNEYCMYLGAHDSDFLVHSMLARGNANGDVTLEMDKLIFVAPGKSWKNAQAVLWLYRGNWQQGAEYYRSWIDTVIPPFKKKTWVDESNGMLSVVAKQTFGSETWKYDKIPTLYDIAKKHGCDSICYYGAFFSDHRDLLGNIEPIQTMGGEESLRASIKKIHDDNGHIILHYPGHRMEMNSVHYPTIGHKLESKNHWGNPHIEQYASPASSEYLRTFGEISSVAICPGCEEWQELIAAKSRQIMELGADGALFDEVKSFQHYVHSYIAAMMAYPCFDPEHNHENPSSAYSDGRKSLLSRLSKEAEGFGDFALLCECANDAFMPYVSAIKGNASHSSGSERDCAHSGGATPSIKGGRARAIDSSSTIVLNMPEFFRHTFPEVTASLSNYSPYLKPRLANYALCYGFKFLFSLMTQLDKQFIEKNEYPEWQEYAQKVCALRKKHADLLLKGKYSCDPELTAANPALCHGVFTADGCSCIVFWNDSNDEVSLDLCGKKISHWESATDSGNEIPEKLAENDIIVLFLECDNNI